MGAGRAMLHLVAVALLVGAATAGAKREVFQVPARTYYIQAQPSAWQFLPGGESCVDHALMSKLTLSQATLYNNHIWEPAANYTMDFQKAQYVEYTDATFTTPKVRPANQQHLGILGPMLYAEAGTTIQVVFSNALSFPVNIEPAQGFTWSKAATGTAVGKGKTATFTWSIPADAVALPAGITTPAQALDAGVQTSRMFLYHSSVDAQAHDNAGLLGPIIVTAQGMANADGTSKGIDRDVVTVFQVADETASAFAGANAAGIPQIPDGKTYSINGRSWCNAKDINVTVGEKVRWHVASTAIEDNIHNIHWHGNVLTHEGHRMDAINMFGWNTATLDMQPDSPGQWFFHCHVNLHLDRGMVTTYNTLPNAAIPVPPPLPPGGKTVTYYIQAEEVDWNYAPYDKYMCGTTSDNGTRPFSDFERQYLGTTSGERIGSVYKKAIYVEYTDAKFTKRKAGTSWPTRLGTANEYMGYLGPIINANIGDTIRVVFKNNLKYAASMHPHGVFYDKANEGAAYMDGARDQVGDDAVQPGQIYTYTWLVPKRTGPTAQDGSSSMWIYHSHVDESGDTNAGLFGAIVIGQVTPDIIEKSFIISVIDETVSIYALDNVQKYLGITDPAALTTLFNSDVFKEDCKHHSINGWMYCNNKPMTFTAGQKYRFYLTAYGAQTDLHTPSISGGTYSMLGLHKGSFAIAGGGMNTIDVLFTEPNQGTDAYNMLCRVHDHVLAGMLMRYNVLPPASSLVTAGTTVRKYFIAAESVNWDYFNGAPGSSCPASYNLGPQAVSAALSTFGSIRKKALFREYTDATFTTRKARDAYLGFQGPIIVGEVGDIIEVTLINKLDQVAASGNGPFDVRFQVDGGLVSARLDSLSNHQVVSPGQTFTYRWVVPPQLGAAAGDLSTVVLPYFSDVDVPSHISSGLYGVAVFGNQGTFGADGFTPKDVDKMLVMFFSVDNEDLSLYTQSGNNGKVIATDFNQMHHINGYMFCNMPAPTVTAGSKVRVLAASFGSEDGVNSPNFVGQTTIMPWGRVEFENLLPSITAQADLRITSGAGVWPVEDKVSNHRASGEIASLNVAPAAGRKLM